MNSGILILDVDLIRPIISLLRKLFQRKLLHDVERLPWLVVLISDNSD